MQSEAAILRQLQLDEAVVRVTAVNSAPYEVGLPSSVVTTIFYYIHCPPCCLRFELNLCTLFWAGAGPLFCPGQGSYTSPAATKCDPQVEESLSAVERCALFLGANAEKVQVLHAIHSLPALVATHGRSIFQSVPVKRAASQVDDECSIALANVLQTILDESMLQVRSLPHSAL